MTYGELIEKIELAFRDSQGMIRGEIVQVLYNINKLALEHGKFSETDMEEVERIFHKHGLFAGKNIKSIDSCLSKEAHREPC